MPKLEIVIGTLNKQTNKGTKTEQFWIMYPVPDTSLSSILFKVDIDRVKTRD